MAPVTCPADRPTRLPRGDSDGNARRTHRGRLRGRRGSTGRLHFSGLDVELVLQVVDEVAREARDLVEDLDRGKASLALAMSQDPPRLRDGEAHAAKLLVAGFVQVDALVV